MGMGRMEMELDYADDATEKRRVLEIEKEDTEELRQKYKDYAEKQKAIAKALEDLRANFYCELCDKQYQKHQEFDNHINSYDHAHKQRLKELKQREFARNVSSRSRKDGRKQEKMLRRLHELAEQRKQQNQTPGSGPMFKATTVAVDGENSESGVPNPECTSVADSVPEGLLGEDKTLSNPGQLTRSVSPKQPSISFTLGKKNSSMTPAAVLPKLSVSFSLAKKAPVKLETAAAVFADQGEEEALEEEGQEEASASNRESPSNGPPVEQQQQQQQQQQSDEGGSLASTLSKLKTMMMKKEEGLSGQEPQYYHYVPPAHCRVKPHFQFLLFMKASDQTGIQKQEEAVETKLEDKQPKATAGKLEIQKDKLETQKAPVSEPPADLPSVKIEQGMEDSPESSTIPKEVPTDCLQGAPESSQGPRLSTGAFFSVLSKDDSTVLQWPSELQEFTRTQPSISYSCNPLYFDFKLSRRKGAQSGKRAETMKSSAEDSDISKAVTSKMEKAGPSAVKKDTSMKEEPTEGEKDVQMQQNSTASMKKKKKKKKHKKPGKSSKQNEEGKEVIGEEAETSCQKEKKKKHKCKKSKTKKSGEEEEKGGKDESSAEVPVAGAVEGTGARKRKRPIKEEAQRPGSGEGAVGKGPGKTSSSDELNGTKKQRSDPDTTSPHTTSMISASSTSVLKLPSSRERRDSRHLSSESEEERRSSSSQRSRRRRSTPRHRRRHSEESGRSRSRSSRRGGRHSRSSSSSSDQSSDGGSRYSRHTYSDSYSDYSNEGRGHPKHSSDSDYERRGSSRRRSDRHRYSSSSSADSSRSRSRSRRRRRARHSSSRSSSSSSSSRRSWRKSSYSRSHSSASRSPSSRGSSRRRRDSSPLRREFNRSRIYRSQSPRQSRASGHKDLSRNSIRGTSSTQRVSAAGGSRSGSGANALRNSLTARQLLENVQSRKGLGDSAAGAKAGLKLKNPPQGYFGPKLPPSLGSKTMLPLFGKLPVGKKPPQPSMQHTGEVEKNVTSESSEAGGDVVLVEPIREFPPPPPVPASAPQKLEETVESAVAEEVQHPNTEEQASTSIPLFEQNSGLLVQQYQGDPVEEGATSMLEPQHAPQDQQALHPYPRYPPACLEEDMGLEAEDGDSLAPLESQPITFTPEEMEKYSKLQQAAQQHIQQQLLAKQVKSFPSSAVAVAAAAAAAATNLAPAAPAAALQPIHMQQPPASASATSITTVQHTLLQHHAATAAAIGIHPHAPHPHQLAQVHHIPQHHLTPISLSPLGHSLGHTLGHSLGHAGLIPAHPTAFLSGQPIHIIPASALHHTPLALHHVPHAALYPTLLTPRPATAAAAAALQLHPLLHPIFSGQDLQHPPGHGS